MATLLSAEQLEQSSGGPSEIEVPAATAWPFVLAFGFTLMFAGLLTSVSVSVLGAVLAVAGCVGWFQEVFPHEHEVVVPLVPGEIRIATERRVVERLPVAADQLRAWLPVHTYPISAGREGRIGRKRSNGRASLRLRRTEGRKHLVSHQSSCRGGLRAIA